MAYKLSGARRWLMPNFSQIAITVCPLSIPQSWPKGQFLKKVNFYQKLTFGSTLGYRQGSNCNGDLAEIWHESSTGPRQLVCQFLSKSNRAAFHHIYCAGFFKLWDNTYKKKSKIIKIFKKNSCSTCDTVYNSIVEFYLDPIPNYPSIHCRMLGLQFLALHFEPQYRNHIYKTKLKTKYI